MRRTALREAHGVHPRQAPRALRDRAQRQPGARPGDDGVLARHAARRLARGGQDRTAAELDAGREPYRSDAAEARPRGERPDSCSGETRDAAVADRRFERGNLPAARSEYQDDEVHVAQGLGPCHDGALFRRARSAQTGRRAICNGFLRHENLAGGQRLVGADRGGSRPQTLRGRRGARGMGRRLDPHPRECDRPVEGMKRGTDAVRVRVRTRHRNVSGRSLR